MPLKWKTTKEDMETIREIVKRAVGDYAGMFNPLDLAPDYPEGRKLDCGHVVYYKSHVMSASLGSSCADCYDKMSD